MQAIQTYPLSGVTAADRTHPITTLHQFGGSGLVLNKVLVLPRLGSTLHRIEHISILATSSIGEQENTYDEVVYIGQGAGELLTNGELCPIRVGDLVITPRGTRYRLRNIRTIEPLCFLSIKVEAPREPVHTPIVIESLPQLLRLESEQYRVQVRQQQIPVNMAQISLDTRLAGPWGDLILIELPPGGQIEEYNEREYDENLFIIKGRASITLGGLDLPFTNDEDPEHGLNMFIPAGLPRTIKNRASDEPLSLLLVHIQNAHGAGENSL